ncbi:hypothetical protein Syun_017692 [Stephania yunnanensis]|uniref:Uncharacterized protein n=1 Tax=Stephania yunnanensis TaxID=152371 RepID=A0AAP0J938_9MAGN
MKSMKERKEQPKEKREREREREIKRRGAVAGVYVGSEYGIERIRGTFTRLLQKNAMLGGALTGALVSAASNNDKNKIIMDAVTGGAVATAAEFINYLT